MKRVLFVCHDNASLSQMAEAFARVDGSEDVEAYSAGLQPADMLDPRTRQLMQEVGCDLDRQDPKPLAELAGLRFDAVIALGRQLAVPAVALQDGALQGRWPLADPTTLDDASARELRDDLAERVRNLMDALEAQGEGGAGLADLG